MKQFVTVTLAAILTFAPLSLLAQALDTSRLRPVVISATKGGNPFASPTQAGTVITGEELRARGITRVSDALQQAAGAMIVQSGSVGSVTSLFLRGGESRYTKVLIDGVPVNAAGGFFDFSHLTTDNIDRIEILRGPASVVYGADAVSGVVQIFTRGMGFGTQLNGSARGGSLGTHDGTMEFARERDANGFVFGAGYHGSDGTLPFNNQYSNGTLSAGTFYHYMNNANGHSIALRSDARYTTAEFHYPTDYTGAPVDSNSYRLQHRLIGSLSSWWEPANALSVGLLLGSNDVSDITEDIAVPFGGTSPRHSVFASRNFRRTVELRTSYEIPLIRRWITPPTLTSGLEYETERERSGNRAGAVGATASPTDGFLDRRHNVAYYGELLGLMFNRLSYNFSGRRDDNSEYSGANTYRLGLNVRVPAGVHIRGSLATAFNAPAFNQIHPTTYTVGSPNLQPERTRTSEIGAERIWGADRFRIAGAYFNQRFGQLIQYVDGGPPKFLGSYANLTAASANGYEGEFELRPISPLRLRGSFTVVAPRVSELAPTYAGSLKVGDALIRRPTHSSTLGLAYSTYHGRTFGVDAAYVGKRPDIDFSKFPSPTLTLPSHVRVDVSGVTPLLKQSGWHSLLLTARVENALGKKYQDVIGFPAPGRVILVGLSFTTRHY